MRLLIVMLLCGCRGTTPTPETTPSGPTAPTAAPTEPATPAEPETPPRDEAAARPEVPTFVGRIEVIDEILQAEMLASGSMKEGCPVGFDGLRLLTLSHHDFEGAVQQGELVVAAEHAEAMVDVFRTLFEARFPIERMRRIDHYGASDDASMADDNTSAFNCRFKTKGKTWSQHSYGNAVDINPLVNPYISNPTAPQESWRVYPPGGKRFLDRTRDLPGLIRDDDVVVQAFTEIGWKWGGNWTRSVDYQHFSSNGQ